MNTLEELANYYSTHDENARLDSRHGKVEFITIVRYIEIYLKSNMRILEIGAGTGKYSHYLAQRGYSVDAVELVESLHRGGTTAGIVGGDPRDQARRYRLCNLLQQ